MSQWGMALAWLHSPGKNSQDWWGHNWLPQSQMQQHCKRQRGIRGVRRSPQDSRTQGGTESCRLLRAW